MSYGQKVLRRPDQERSPKLRADMANGCQGCGQNAEVYSVFSLTHATLDAPQGAQWRDLVLCPTCAGVVGRCLCHDAKAAGPAVLGAIRRRD